MIVFMGSSFTRGGWGYRKKEIFLSTIVQQLSGYNTLNLATPCHGSEKYLSSFLYACKYYKPKLFFVEAASDRSAGYFYIPNSKLEQVNQSSPENIHEIFNTYGIDDFGRNDFRIQSFSDQNDDRVKTALETCNEPIEIKKMLQYFNYTRLVTDSFLVQRYKTINNYMSLETLSEITNIPILYYSYIDTEFQSSKTFMETVVPVDRFLNKFYKMSGVVNYTNDKLNGKHLADECHHNYDADVLFAKDLLIPFIENYCTKYNIVLDKVGVPGEF